MPRPDPRDRSLLNQRELLKFALQQPQLVAKGFDDVPLAMFTHPAYAAVSLAIANAGGVPSTEKQSWIAEVNEKAANDAVRSVVNELAGRAHPGRGWCAGEVCA